MAALLLIINTVLHQFEVMTVKAYGKKYGSGGLFFNGIICLFATLFFIITDKGGLVFPPEIFAYGFVSCLMFATGFYAMYLALRFGSFATTRLVSSFSNVLPIVYGILILHDPTSIWSYIGILLTFLSMFIMNYTKPGKDDRGFSVKWLVSVMAVVVSNGFIAIIQKMQQLHFDKAYDNEFMIISLGGAAIALFILGAILEKDKLSVTFKKGFLYGAAAGVFNGSANFVNLLIFLYVPISLMSPLKTGLNLVTSFALSIFLYKEKFTKKEIVSVITGALAILMFNVEAIISFFA